MVWLGERTNCVHTHHGLCSSTELFHTLLYAMSIDAERDICQQTLFLNEPLVSFSLRFCQKCLNPNSYCSKRCKTPNAHFYYIHYAQASNIAVFSPGRLSRIMTSSLHMSFILHFSRFLYCDETLQDRGDKSSSCPPPVTKTLP